MAVNDIDLFSDDDVSKHREEREDGGESRCAVNDEKWDVVDFQAVREVANASAALICVRYDYDFVSSIDELGGELVDVAFYSSGGREEEVADHSNVVRHVGGLEAPMLSTVGHWSAQQFEIKRDNASSC